MNFFLKIKREFLHVLPVFFFFFVAFTLINWTEAFLFEKAGIIPFKFIEVAIAAALIAKIILVVDHLPWISFCSNKPLIYLIGWKTMFYWVILLLVRFSIRYIPYTLMGDGLKGDFFLFLSHFDWRLFFSIQTYYLMLLFLFVTGREVTRVIGASRMRQLFWGRK